MAQDPLMRSLLQLKEELNKRAMEIARASHEDNLYRLGRAQGFLDGLEYSAQVIEGKIEEADQ